MEAVRHYLADRRPAGGKFRPPAEVPTGEGLLAAAWETGKYHFLHVIPTLLRYVKTNNPDGESIS
jgi:hypothetical protein